jgi:hypothetical protein
MMNFYHGTESDHLIYSSYGGQSDDPDMLFASASYSIAMRYGRQVFSVQLTRDVKTLPRISVDEWFSGSPLPAGSFIIEAKEGDRDFGADTLVIRNEQDINVLPNLKMTG